MTLHVSIVSCTASTAYVHESVGFTLGLHRSDLLQHPPVWGWVRIISDCPLVMPTVERVIQDSAEEVGQF